MQGFGAALPFMNKPVVGLLDFLGNSFLFFCCPSTSIDDCRRTFQSLICRSHAGTGKDGGYKKEREGWTDFFCKLNCDYYRMPESNRNPLTSLTFISMLKWMEAWRISRFHFLLIVDVLLSSGISYDGSRRGRLSEYDHAIGRIRYDFQFTRVRCPFPRQSSGCARESERGNQQSLPERGQ